MPVTGEPARTLLIGSTGGIGTAIRIALPAGSTVCLARTTTPGLDVTDEASIASAAAALSGVAPFARIIVATGVLAMHGVGPEKRLAELDPAVMARAFAVNAIGPALLIKHFVELLPRQGRCVFAVLSARVGSIGDNRLGGWYSYRASKAALNQVVRTASVEIAGRRPQAVVLALHPGTVRTDLSAPFTSPGQGLSPEDAALQLLAVMESAEQSGAFLDQNGVCVPW